MQVGIDTLRSLIALRKANMKECLDLLLSYGVNPGTLLLLLLLLLLYTLFNFNSLYIIILSLF